MPKEIRSRSFWLALGKNFLAALGVLALPVTGIAGFAPEMLPKHLNILWLMIGVSGIYSVRRSWLKPVQQEFAGGYTVQLVVGDLFDQNGNCLVGMTDTFDVETPNIISKESVQGQLLDKVWGGRTQELQKLISALLSDAQSIESVTKLGNDLRYPLGTTLALRDSFGKIYFCTAYASMNEKNVAKATVESLTTSLYAVWEKTDQEGNHAPIFVPLVGQGLSRIPGLGPEAALRLIALTFVLRSNRGKVSSALKIVVSPSQIKRIDRREFSAFLRALSEVDLTGND